MTTVDEGSYRISGRFGEGFFLDPTGRRPPMKIIEATAITFEQEIAIEDVQLSGNRTGSKDGGENPGTGTMTLQKIDNFFDNIVAEAFSGNLDLRRRARDAGTRIPRTFTLQVWEDDPEALGAIGHQLEGVRLPKYEGGFNFADTVTMREHAFRFDRFRKLKAFERIGNTVDAATGLPAIRYTDDLTK